MTQFSATSRDRARLITLLETIGELTDEQKRRLVALPMRVSAVGDRTDVFAEGNHFTECCLILEGFLGRYKTVADGARQFVSFHMPGDMPDLQSLHLEHMDHGLLAMTPSRVGFIPHAAVRALMEEDKGVAAILTKYMLIDASIFREWIANVGRRDALSRVAHLFCELLVRFRMLGLARDNILHLPLTQGEIADATGLSAVHVNRVLQELRHLKFISSKGHNHTVLSGAGLQQLGDFNPAYLHLRHPAHGVGF